MNKDNAKDYLPLVQALAEGKTIQINAGTPGIPLWEDVDDPVFSGPVSDYRVKPEPREWFVVVATETNKEYKEGYVHRWVNSDEVGSAPAIIGDEWKCVRVREVKE